MRRSGVIPDGPGTLAPLDRPIVVHSHLRWDFVWQRPQQILSRMAAHAPVLFIEEPIFLDDVADPRLDISVPFANVFRAIPQLPGTLRDDADGATAVVRTLAQDAIAERLSGLFANPINWFYSPATAPSMLGAFNEIAVVYDCMDELAQFRFAHPDLPRRERLLLANADIVFTGGRKLYEAKRRFHRNVHFFGCGVDVAHFGKARLDETEIPADIAELPKPVYGYFGVVDERIDYDLIEKLAAHNPAASVVIVGPIVKVDPAALPKAANIHWLGKREYDVLPNYVKGFDVCLMPFALNEATEFINPTKTLEYMAARKPIVSTAVADVVRNFTPIVRIAKSSAEFVTLAARAARSPDLVLLAEGVRKAGSASWENIVGNMQTLIAAAIDEATPETRDVAARPARLGVGQLAVQ
ncbi:MAG TPA: glycosyltransferase [Gemmatimonadaceae bacterium]|nr:glycosyltransferase [Gemmatimonadaceae bacterium]